MRASRARAEADHRLATAVAAICDSDLRAPSRLVALALAAIEHRIMRQAWDEYVAWDAAISVAVSTLVQMTGMSRRAVQSAIADLERRGAIVCARRRGAISSYRLTTDALRAAVRRRNRRIPYVTTGAPRAPVTAAPPAPVATPAPPAPAPPVDERARELARRRSAINSMMLTPMQRLAALATLDDEQ